MPKILNIPLYDKNISSFISQEILRVYNFNNNKTNRCISATGAHGLVYSKKNFNFGKVLTQFYCNLPDGMSCVWIGRLKGASDMQRCYGPDFFRETIIATRNTSLRHFFCGGKEGVAIELMEVCNHTYCNKNVVGIFSPPFRELDDSEIMSLAEMIDELKIDIVWIGLSTPKQELFAHRLAQFTHVHFICTVGAAFDFHTGKVKQAPSWIQKIGMEWCFRLIIEPKRLWRRYIEIVPLFLWYNIRELITGEFYNN